MRRRPIPSVPADFAKFFCDKRDTFSPCAEKFTFEPLTIPGKSSSIDKLYPRIEEMGAV